jgi:FSR family fosmidomycin resistance protein-like MFS transporter
MNGARARAVDTASPASGTVLPVLAAISFSHLLNDTIQSLLPAIYPVLKTSLRLSFAQIGLVTLTLQFTASILQPIVGLYTDRHPTPYSLVAGMASSLAGLLLLSVANTLGWLLLAAGLLGLGSAVFHPESSRVARLASGGRHGLAQSVFQVGGNVGSSLGPLLAAVLVVPYGQRSLAWCAIVAVLALLVLWKIGGWLRERLPAQGSQAVHRALESDTRRDRRRVWGALAILLALIFSKYVYLASLHTFYTFYLIEKFDVSVQTAQLDLFLFLFAIAAGTVVGGPIGDRFGRKWVIWGSIVGVLPFTLALPYASLGWTRGLVVAIGFILASAFSTILVYATELIPNRVGLVAGLFFGFAFGVAGLGAAALGYLADRTSLELVFKLCSFLPFIGLLTGLLPQIEAAPRLQTADLR